MAKKKIKESSLNKMSASQLEEWTKKQKEKQKAETQKAKLLKEAKDLRKKI